MALAKKTTDSFFNTEPAHPHLRLHILISILAVVVVSSAIWIYKVSMDKGNVIETTLPTGYPTTAEELRLIAEKISSGPSESPPTQAEMEQMALKISKTSTGQNTLSASDLELQAQILNK